jgi:hypothetical protein
LLSLPVEISFVVAVDRLASPSSSSEHEDATNMSPMRTARIRRTDMLIERPPLRGA